MWLGGKEQSQSVVLISDINISVKVHHSIDRISQMRGFTYEELHKLSSKKTDAQCVFVM